MSSNCVWLRKGFAAEMRKHRWGLKCGEKQGTPMQLNGEQVCRIVQTVIGCSAKLRLKGAFWTDEYLRHFKCAKGIMHSASCIESHWTRCPRGAQVPGQLSFEICLNCSVLSPLPTMSKPFLCNSMSSYCTFTPFSASIFHSMEPLSSSPITFIKRIVFASLALFLVAPGDILWFPLRP